MLVENEHHFAIVNIILFGQHCRKLMFTLQSITNFTNLFVAAEQPVMEIACIPKLLIWLHVYPKLTATSKHLLTSAGLMRSKFIDSHYPGNGNVPLNDHSLAN